MATISSTVLSGYQIRACGICNMLDNTWLLCIAGWIKKANTVFCEERTEWLLGCFIVLLYLLVLSDLEFSIDVSIRRERGLAGFSDTLSR